MPGLIGEYKKTYHKRYRDVRSPERMFDRVEYTTDAELRNLGLRHVEVAQTFTISQGMFESEDYPDKFEKYWFDRALYFAKKIQEKERPDDFVRKITLYLFNPSYHTVESFGDYEVVRDYMSNSKSE